MRTPFIAANWKMYKTVAEAVAYLKAFTELAKDVSDVEIVVAPPFTALYAAAEMAKHSNVGIAAQDLHWEREGAFTSGISAGDDQGDRGGLRHHRPLGAAPRLRRHRRSGEQEAAWPRSRPTSPPIVCVGETLDERDGGQTLAVLDRQVEAGLKGLTAEQVAALVIAYEPVWAIGTGRNATPAQAGEAHAHIRSRLARLVGCDAADSATSSTAGP